MGGGWGPMLRLIFKWATAAGGWGPVLRLMAWLASTAQALWERLPGAVHAFSICSVPTLLPARMLLLSPAAHQPLRVCLVPAALEAELAGRPTQAAVEELRQQVACWGGLMLSVWLLCRFSGQPECAAVEELRQQVTRRRDEGFCFRPLSFCGLGCGCHKEQWRVLA